MGISQKELAARVEISTSYLNLIENGKRALGRELLDRLVQALGDDSVLGDAAKQQSQFEALNYLYATKDADAFVATESVWAERLLDAHREILDLRARLAKQASPLDHDRFLHDQLHELLSHATSLLSIANVLNTHGNIPPKTHAEFRARNEAEAQALSVKLRELVEHFERERQDIGREGNQQIQFFRWLESSVGNRNRFLALANQGWDDGAIRVLLHSALGSERKIEWLCLGLAERFLRDLRGVNLDEFDALATQYQWDMPSMAAALDWPADRLLRVIGLIGGRGMDATIGLSIGDPSGQYWLPPTNGYRAFARDVNCAYWPDRAPDLVDGQFLHRRMVFDDGQNVTAICAQSQWASQGNAPMRMRTQLTIDALWPEAAVGAIERAGLNCDRCQRNDCPYRRHFVIPR